MRDGYSGLDYSIRTEVPMEYYDDEGYVGMASAGPHTEGTQWFITHSPTPHLEMENTRSLERWLKVWTGQ